MGSEYDQGGDRLADDTQSWLQSCATSETGWDTGDKFVVTIRAICSERAGCAQTNFKLQWQDDTDTSGYTDLASTGELKWGTGQDPGDNGCGPPIAENQFVQNGNNATFSAKSETDEIQLSVVVDPAGADSSHEYSFQLYDTTAGKVIGQATSTITMAAGAPTSSHTTFQTPRQSGSTHASISWIWNSGQFNVDSGMRATDTSGISWTWSVVSSSSNYYYPSGDYLSWEWVSGNAYT